MNVITPDPARHPRRERMNRVRIGATGLAVIMLIVLLAASFSGAASDEPELTPEAIAEERAAIESGEATEKAPQEPLAEMGVAPATTPAVGTANGESTETADPE